MPDVRLFRHYFTLIIVSFHYFAISLFHIISFRPRLFRFIALFSITIDIDGHYADYFHLIIIRHY